MKKDLSAWDNLLDELEKALRELEHHMTKEEFVLFLDTLIRDLTITVSSLESENEWNAKRLKESVSSAVNEIKNLQNETRSLNSKIATETSQAIKRTVTTLESEIRKTVQTQSAEVFAEVKKEIDESKKLLESTREQLRVERGFRKFLFWATPILLLAQTIAIIIAAI